MRTDAAAGAHSLDSSRWAIRAEAGPDASGVGESMPGGEELGMFVVQLAVEPGERAAPVEGASEALWRRRLRWTTEVLIDPSGVASGDRHA